MCISTLPRCLICGLILALLYPSLASAASAKDVDAALKKAIDYLYSKQENGNWENVQSPKVPPQWDDVDGIQWGGLTGIATYALLAAEQDPADPRIGEAVDFLQNAQLQGVYATGVRAQVWPFMQKVRKVKPFAQRDLELLLNACHTKGPGKGLWFYYLNKPEESKPDHSASQFALLGVWACEEAGVEVPSGFWKIEDQIWRRDQMPGGGWAYVYEAKDNWGEPKFSMTLAGLASLYITQEKMLVNTNTCVAQPVDAVLDAGIKFIAANYPTDWDNPPPNTWMPGSGRRQLYALFGLSRLGLASGLRYFGNNDWYRNGSDYICRIQADDGSIGGGTWETAMGILFLARGRAPVAFNKLEYNWDTTANTKKQPVQTWNIRPRDVANEATWMGKQLEKRINWQVVDINTNPDEWLDAPILYIAGNDDLKFTPEQTAKLKRFVEGGGLILGNADCASGKFAATFKKLGETMFPASEWAELPANHPIYTREQFLRTKWKSKPRIVSINNGVRELMILCPDADLGRAYSVDDDHGKPEAFQFGVDLCEYMAGLDLRHRGESAFVSADPAVTGGKPLKIARLKFTGNWDPEPGGWRRMAAILHNQSKIDITVDPVDLGGKLNGYALAHLTGTTPVTLTAAQKSALTDFVNAGGTLLVDAAGGNSAFATAMEPQIASLFTEPLTVLPPEAPLYTKGSNPVQTFAYTRMSKSTLGSLKSPRLKAITLKGRPAVFFSSDDLSTGMVGIPVDGVIGYAPDTAVDIVRRIVEGATPTK